ncbi:MAG: hypothetical protein VST68_02740 [Nitrospirota bacterium]|nr:hypothetical protein [Nitrospirota bacterium]
MDKSRFFWMYFSMGILMTLVLTGCTEMQMRDAGSSAESISTSSAGSQVASSVDAASGTQGDTLGACMSRIPSDSTSGQRQLAELSCQRDERTRQPIMVVPGQ